MLLRSSSTPILDSWLLNSRESSPESTHFSLQLLRTKSSSSGHTYSAGDDHFARIPTRPMLEIDFKVPPGSKHSGRTHKRTVVGGNDQTEEVGAGFGTLKRLLSSSGLGKEAVVVREDDMELETALGGGGGSGGGGGGGRGSDGGDWSDSGSYGSDGHDSTDAYYQKMIEANPGNGLILGNYAKFLKEVREDMTKAEEYCGRAILANPNDANVLSLYGDLIWQTEKNAQRAETYFEQAVNTDPNDSFVMASYARFLWDVEDEEEEEEEEEEEKKKKKKKKKTKKRKEEESTIKVITIRPM